MRVSKGNDGAKVVADRNCSYSLSSLMRLSLSCQSCQLLPSSDVAAPAGTGCSTRRSRVAGSPPG
eukprot:768672-Hanusia_phi.AAC.20